MTTEEKRLVRVLGASSFVGRRLRRRQKPLAANVGKHVWGHRGVGSRSGLRRQRKHQSTEQAQALTAGIDRGRAGVTGAFDNAIRARREAANQAIRQMMGGMASPAAGTLVGSGAQGVCFWWWRRHQRAKRLQAGQAANQFRAQSAMDVGQMLQQKAVGELQYAQDDAQAGAARFTAIADDIQQRKNMYSTAADLVAYYRIAANRYPVGSPERQMYLNEIQVYQDTGKYLT